MTKATTKSKTNLKFRMSADIVGPVVTRAADLTVGRWYALGVGTEGDVVHAKYLGPDNRGKHEFQVLQEDRMPGYYKKNISRTDAEIALQHRGGVYKFKAHPDKSEVFPAGTTAAHIGAKVGDKFVVGNGSTHYALNDGDIVELVRDDHSQSPCFRKVGGGGHYCCFWSRLRPLSATEQSADKPAYPKALPAYTRAKSIGAKVGDRFLVVDNTDRKEVALGTILELATDDGSCCPFFFLVKDGKITANRICFSFGRLAPLPKDDVPAEPAPLHPVDALKANIDQLVKESEVKRAESNKALAEAQRLDKLADEKRQQLADALRGYLPAANTVSGKPGVTLLSTGGIDPRPFGKLD